MLTLRKICLSLSLICVTAAWGIAQCSISSVTATAEDCGNDEFFDVLINFNYDQVSDSFEIRGNGVFYGRFGYQNLPVTLSNLDGDCSLEYEFVVIDAQDTNCSDFAELGVICCNPGCSIRNVAVSSVFCIDTTSSNLFTGRLTYDNRNTSDSFDLRGNGNFYGRYAYADEPIQLPELHGDCITAYEFVMVDVEDENCSAAVDFGVMCCDTTFECTINNLSVSEIDCRDNGNYDLTVNFNYSNPNNDFYDIWINNEFAGFYALEDLPQRFENITGRPNSDYDIVRVCINDHPDCCSVLEYMQPNCNGGDCIISDLEIEFTPCNDDGIFSAILSFNYQNTSDSFEVRGNGIFYGTYGYAEEPITIENLLGDCNINYEFAVIDAEDGNCREDIDAGIMCCDSSMICSIFDLTINDIECRNNENYDFTLNFEYENSVSDSFRVWINDRYYGTYLLESLPLRFENIAGRPNSDYDIVRVCMTDRPNCCAVIEYVGPLCDDDPCAIYNFEIGYFQCDSNNLFSIILFFEYRNTSDSFDLYDNGNFYGTFAYTDQPIEIPNLSGDCVTSYEFVLIDSEDEACQNHINLGSMCCDSTSLCSIDDLTIGDFECRDNGNYDLTVDFNYHHPNNEFYDVWINNEFFGFYALNNLPQRLENITPRPNTPYDIIRVCINDQPNCCAVLEYLQPICETDSCSIRDLEVDFTDCNDDGIFSAVLGFNHSETSDSFEIRGNGNFYGVYAYADEPITIENLPGDCNINYEFVVIDSEDRRCRDDIDAGVMCCDSSTICSIFDLTVSDIECRENENYDFTLNFEYENSEADSFRVWINNRFYGTYLLATLPLRFENITGRPNSDYDIVRVCMTDRPNCCAAIEYIGPLCDDGLCAIRNFEIGYIQCDSNNLFSAILSFDNRNTSDSFDLRGNGNFYGTFAYDDQPIEIPNLSGDCETPYEFVMIDSDDEACLNDIDFGIVCCDSTLVCSIDDLRVIEIDCRENGNYDLTLDFNHEYSFSEQFGVWINNEFLGYHPLDELPMRFQNISERPNSDYDIVRVCMSNRPNCCSEIEYMQPECGDGDCVIRDLVVESSPCDSIGEFSVDIAFNYNNVSDSFEVRGNGIFYGTYAYLDEPITIAGLEGNCETPYEFVLIDTDNPNCAEDIGIGIVCCDSTLVCSIDNLAVGDFECRDNGNYDLTVSFDYEHPGNALYDIWINNEYAGFYALDDLPQRFEDIEPRDSSDFDVVRVCINDQPNCCSVLEYLVPPCITSDNPDFIIRVMGDQVVVERPSHLTEDYNIGLYDMLGQNLMLQSTDLSRYQIDLASWHTGIYIIDVHTDAQRKSMLFWLRD